MPADRSRRMLQGAAIAIALSVAGCAAGTRSEEVGAARIWDVQAKRFIDEPTLVARLAGVRYRLLGEVHDNPDHHRLRARVITAIASTGRSPAVVMEQLDFGREAALADAQRHGASADEVAAAGGLDRRSWRWPMHEPIIAAALAARLPVYPGNVPRKALDAVVRNGDAGTVDDAWRMRLSRSAWTEARSRELAQEIAESHCGKLPPSLVPRLALAQRLRDAAMAEALVRDATADGALLIAGNGHVRGDLGVPLYLDAARNDEVVKVAWVEVERAPGPEATPASLLADYPGFDYLWFTRRVEREDPCRGIPDLPPARNAATAAPSPSRAPS